MAMDDAHVKTPGEPAESLKTTRVKIYYQGFILVDLNQAGFLRQHHG
jgi:hypothetical protein